MLSALREYVKNGRFGVTCSGRGGSRPHKLLPCPIMAVSLPSLLITVFTFIFAITVTLLTYFSNYSHSLLFNLHTTLSWSQNDVSHAHVRPPWLSLNRRGPSRPSCCPIQRCRGPSNHTGKDSVDRPRKLQSFDDSPERCPVQPVGYCPNCMKPANIP
jgi:hypothetical protein